MIHKEAAEDTATTKTCTTDADANRTISEVIPGQYLGVETTGVPQHATAPDQNITSVPADRRPPREHVGHDSKAEANVADCVACSAELIVPVAP